MRGSAAATGDFSGGASEIEREQAREQLFIGEVCGETVGGGDGVVERAVSEVEPRRALIVCSGSFSLFNGGVE